MIYTLILDRMRIKRIIATILATENLNCPSKSKKKKMRRKLELNFVFLRRSFYLPFLWFHFHLFFSLILSFLTFLYSHVQCAHRYETAKRAYEDQFQREINKLIALQSTGYEAARMNRYVFAFFFFFPCGFHFANIYIFPWAAALFTMQTFVHNKHMATVA